MSNFIIILLILTYLLITTFTICGCIISGRISKEEEKNEYSRRDKGNS